MSVSHKVNFKVIYYGRQAFVTRCPSARLLPLCDMTTQVCMGPVLCRTYLFQRVTHEWIRQAEKKGVTGLFHKS